MTDNGTFITTLGRLGQGLYQAVRGRLWEGGAPSTSPVDLWGYCTVTPRVSTLTVTPRASYCSVTTRTKELTVQ